MSRSTPPNISFDFRDQTVIHTGSAQGIGFATVQFFLEHGAEVIAVDLNAESLRLLAETHPHLTIVEGDVADPETAKRAIEASEGRVEILVNNAGILRDRVHWKLTDDDWTRVVDVHLRGTFNFLRECTPIMRTSSYGRVVNTTSYAGIRGNFGQVNYSAAKAGIIGLTKAAAKELAPFGVTVNAISPNAQTAMIDSIPAQRREEIREEVPMKRFSTPEEVTPAIGFLASRAAGYITGSVLPIDGGIAI